MNAWKCAGALVLGVAVTACSSSSPRADGGTVNGCDELATAIYQARSKKPVYAYVSG